MTVLCGLVRTFPQLVLARVGVGVGEAGCSPPAHSILSDYYPPERRGTAFADVRARHPDRHGVRLLHGRLDGGVARLAQRVPARRPARYRTRR